MLGICFGQQLLASALCGREQVFRRQSCEVGYKSLKTTNLIKDDSICSHLDESVSMFVWHNDEVKPNHPDLNIIAYSDDNAYAIFESMNDRGLNLTSTEMLKGFILSRFQNGDDRNKTNSFWSP